MGRNMIFKKKHERKVSKMTKRAAMLPVSELIPWSDSVLYSIAKNLSSWQKTEAVAYLEEARVNTEALYAIVESLHARVSK